MCSLLAFRSPQHATNPGTRGGAVRVTLEPGATAMTHIGKWNSATAIVSAGWRRSAMNSIPPDSRRKGPQ